MLHQWKIHNSSGWPPAHLGTLWRPCLIFTKKMNLLMLLLAIVASFSWKALAKRYRGIAPLRPHGCPFEPIWSWREAFIIWFLEKHETSRSPWEASACSMSICWNWKRLTPVVHNTSRHRASSQTTRITVVRTSYLSPASHLRRACVRFLFAVVLRLISSPHALCYLLSRPAGWTGRWMSQFQCFPGLSTLVQNLPPVKSRRLSKQCVW